MKNQTMLHLDDETTKKKKKNMKENFVLYKKN